ncbi:MAG: hypothetical protein NTY60_02825 [Proteobacteria bacterium]|nr:hypothetical protein [Pseudomonadota bacterium]
MDNFQTLVAHGAAHYQHDEKEAGSYFATLQNENGKEKTVWGVDIQRSLEAAGVEIGDKIELSVGEIKPVTIQEKQLDGTTIEKTVKRNEWITNKKQPEISKEIEVDGTEPQVASLATAQTIETEQTPEQSKRAALAEEYEKEISPARDARNTAIETHEKEFANKWAALQGDIAKVRTTVSEKFEIDNVPQKQRDNILAMETAKLIEHHEVSKHEAAIKLDKELPAVKKWVEFLEEKSISNDPAVLDLLADAKEAPEASMTGISDGVPRSVVMSDLSFKADKDSVKYLRGKDEIITDRGHRLDVKRLDDRDIQAALQIASQKFDMNKGLILSGDVAFRTRSAELAGRMGLNVQNMSPEMQKAWDRGQRSTAVLKQHERPNIANSISGEAKHPEHVLLKVDQRIDIQALLESGTGLKAGPDVNSLLMNPEQYMGAMDAWRNTDSKTLEALAHADINRADGGLDVTEIAGSAPELVDGNGLSPLAKELVLVRDAKTIDARELAQNPSIYKTIQDRVAEEKAQQLQTDKSLNVRNIDAQDAEKAKEIEKVRDEKSKHVEKQEVTALKEHKHEHQQEHDKEQDPEQDHGLGF